MVDGKPQVIEFQDQNHRGLITFYVNKGEHSINILYEETKIRKLANIISLVSLVSLLTVLGLFLFKSRVKKGYNKKA